MDGSETIEVIEKIPPCPKAFHYGAFGLFEIPRPCAAKYDNVANMGVDLNTENLIAQTNEPLALALQMASPTEIPPSEIALENLYPALVECFAVIICGYLAGRLNVIPQADAKGLNTFVGTFALPSLIFMSMATLDFSSVNWYFLLAVLLAKTTVFIAVLVVSLLVTKPVNLAKSGLFAIFCTQSNDFALGYPIVAALYGKAHPEYPSYLYLVAPISLVFLNPIAFFLMELGKRKEQVEADLSLANLPEEGVAGLSENDVSAKGRKTEKGFSLGLQLLRSVLFNPIVLMTTLGICGNFIFRHCLPVMLEGFLKVMGSAFSATALFTLGLRMVGKMHQLRGANLVVPGILIGVKCLVLPLVTREFINSLEAGGNINDTLDLSNYGFLYGTFPTAPGVFVYSIQFNVESDMIASAMVACTFLSAPLMFISAKMVTITNLNPSNYVSDLDSFLFDVSIVGIISTAWVIGVFLLSKKWKKIPHFFTLCLVISQFISCLGVLLWSVLGRNETWELYFQFVFIALGVFGSRLWTALLAASLYFLRTRSLCFVLRLRPVFAVIGWGVPAIIAAVLLSTVSQEAEREEKSDPNFQYGRTQAIVATVILLSSFLVTLCCLVLQQRYGKRYHDYQTILTEEDDNDSEVGSSSLTGSASSSNRAADVDNESSSVTSRFSLRKESFAQVDCINTADKDIEDTESFLFSPTGELCKTRRCDVRQQQHCQALLRRYRSTQQLTQPEEETIVRDRDDEYQMLRHVVLLLILCCSMFVGLALCLWTIFMEQPSGIYLELLFLDGALNFGQGFFVCVVFGFDTKLIVAPILKKWRQFRYGAEFVILPKWEALDPETRHICEQFLTYHIDKCIRDLVRDRRWRLQWYRSVFCGNELVDWLIMVGLAHDRSQALRYGRHLLQGRVIRHVNSEYHFHDQPFFYTFLPEGVQA